MSEAFLSELLSAVGLQQKALEHLARGSDSDTVESCLRFSKEHWNTAYDQLKGVQSKTEAARAEVLRAWNVVRHFVHNPANLSEVERAIDTLDTAFQVLAVEKV